MQSVEHARHRNQRRSPLALDRANDFRRIRRKLEHRRRAQQRRHKQRHHLPEDVAQRHQRNKSQRMHPLLILAIRIDAALQRLEVGQKISMRQNDAARLRRRPRRKQNLRNMIPRDRLVGKSCEIGNPRARHKRHTACDLVKDERRNAGRATSDFRLSARGKNQFRICFTCNARRKLNRCTIIERHCHRSAQQASPKRRHPLK